MLIEISPRRMNCCQNASENHFADRASSCPLSTERISMSASDVLHPDGSDFDGCCQTNSNPSLHGQDGCPLFRIKTAPLGKSSGTVQFEIWSGVEAAFRIEEIVNRGVDGGELLQTSHAPEAKHRPLSSSEWQV